jgi:hypothetical protein
MRLLWLAVVATTLGCGRGPAIPVDREVVSYTDPFVLPFGRVDPVNAAGDSLRVRWASHYLRAMNEPRLDPRAFSHDVYRFTYMPSFRPKVTLRLMRRPDGCLYVRKEVREVKIPEDSLQVDTILKAWSVPLSVSAADSVPVGRLECDVIVDHMVKLHLGSGPEPEFALGPDGEGWLFEQIRDGHYQAREVWSPDSSRNSRFYEAGMTFFRVARYAGNGFPARPTTFP